MKLFSKKKKGFTIVELVIVVAVIAVLSAILIPTFVGLVNKANVTADGTLVRELNNALAMDREVNGEHKTMTHALEATERYGFDVAKIDAKASKNKILWDSVHGVFCYLQENAEKVEYVPGSVKAGEELPANDYRLWIISSTVDSTYSTYLYGYTGAKSFTFTRGLDVGKTEGLETLSYTGVGSKQDVVIRTNSFDTTLTIDAASDTVKHYGEVGSLNIIAVDSNNSYHEFGTISQKAQIAEGRLVVESTGNIPLVEVTAVPTAQAPVKIETSKDVVVTVSDAVATSLGENKLPNTEIKVSNTQANVTVDAVVEASSVAINGTPATTTTENLKSVYKATTVYEIENAPDGSYVMLMNNLGPGDMPYETVQGTAYFGGISFPITVTKERPIELKDVTLDLNGHTIEADRYSVASVSGEVEILDSSSEKSGEFKNISAGNIEPSYLLSVNSCSTLTVSGGKLTSTQGVAINVSEKMDANVIINGGTISSHIYAIVLKPAINNPRASLTINGGTITSQTDYAITGHGNHPGTVININGGEINGHKTAIYHPQDGVLNITGGTISGESAVEMRAGTLTVSGNAVLRGNGSYSWQANGSGHTTTGVALAIAQHTTLKDINVTINGGKFEGAKAVAINNPQENATTNVTVTINGGTFSGEIYKNHENPGNASAWTLIDNR